MTFEESVLNGLFVITPKVVEDQRGAFIEVFRMDLFEEQGLHPRFVQMNHSISKPNILRGLHFQWDPPLGKFIRVLRGTAFMAAADIRKSSKTFKKWVGIEVSAANRTCLYAPAGFATGFCVIGSEDLHVEYCYTALYNPKGEGVIRYDDPELRIEWPLSAPMISDRDNAAPSLCEWLERPESNLF